MADPSIHLLGVRHHGPGSARSVRRALDEVRPTAVLVEWPVDGEALLDWIGHPGLVPPVALLGHGAVGSAFLPLAVFSPEWQAVAWAHETGAAVRAIDLPLGAMIHLDHAGRPDPISMVDPLGELAAAAGDTDPERWWDDVVEHRGEGRAAFDAVAAAVGAVREQVPVPDVAATSMTLVREAHMRKCLRAAVAAGHEVIAVVCGAWHVPALESPWPSASSDTALERAGVADVPRGAAGRVALSWVPWTDRRLAAATGYGAGVRSPAWYAHVFRHPGDDSIVRWLVDAAHLLRGRGMGASPDHLIAAARMADALASLRGRPTAGLDEVRDAVDAVMPGGLSLVEHTLVMGDAIGAVPDDAPQAPLAADLAALQRRLRLAPSATPRTLELDLRTPTGRDRSVLLHRLDALDVRWGTLAEGRGSTGTFRETWNLAWEPEMAVRIVERSAYGTTVSAAAAARLLERVANEGSQSVVTAVDVLETALLADLPDVVHGAITTMGAATAHGVDVLELFDAAQPLARSVRYGDVRDTDAAALRELFDSVIARVLAALVPTCRNLDDTAAQQMAERIAAVHAALALVEHSARRGEWPALLAVVAERGDVHGVLQGRAVRLLHDSGSWPRQRVGARLSRALSPGVPPATGAAFVEGLLAGAAVLLLHDDVLIDEIDAWLCSLGGEAFELVVPLLRRTFGALEVAERRAIGRMLTADHDASVVADDDVDAARVAAAFDTLRALFGVPA